MRMQTKTGDLEKLLLKVILTKNYRRVHDQKYSINMKPVLATVKRECIFLVVFFHQFLERLLKLLQRNNSIFLWYNEEDIDRIFLLTFELNKCQKKNLYFYQREFNERVEYMYVITFTSAANLEIEIQCYFHKPKRIVFPHHYFPNVDSLQVHLRLELLSIY